MPRKRPEPVVGPPRTSGPGGDEPPVPGDVASTPEGEGLESTQTSLGFDEAVQARPPRRVWRWVVSTLFVLLFLVAVAGAALWATDYKVTADVEDKRCDALQVTVRTRQLGIEHTVQDVPLAQCLLLEPGDYVEYRIRTQRTTLYDATGDCVYDSVTGPC
jgi:hypothetical protein